MAEEFKIKIPIEIDSKGSGNRGQPSRHEQELGRQNKNMLSNLRSIAIATGVVAVIWKALYPILNPLLKLLSLMLLVVFLPLLPHIKKIAEKISDTIKAIRDGQKDGDGTMDSFAGGIGALFGDMSIVGVLIGAAFLASLSMGTILGALTLGLGFLLVWDVIKGANESSLGEVLKGSMLAGIAFGIAALVFGAGAVPAIPIGILTFSILAAVAFGKKAVSTETSDPEAMKSALIASGAGGLAAGAVVALVTGSLIGMGAAVLTGAVVTIPVGILLFSILTGIRFMKKSGKQDVAEFQDQFMSTMTNSTALTQDLQKEVDSIDFDKIIDSLNQTEQKWMSFNSTIQSQVMGPMNISINRMGELIGSPTKGSYPLVYSLIQAENEWMNMESISSIAINKVIENLEKIPKKIVTIHEIRTVRTGGGISSLFRKKR